MKTKLTLETAECIKAFAISAKRAFERFPQLKQEVGTLYKVHVSSDASLSKDSITSISCCFMGAAAIDNFVPEGAALDNDMMWKIYDYGINWDATEARYPCIKQWIDDEDFNFVHEEGDKFQQQQINAIIVDLNDRQGLSIDEIADRLTAFADAAVVTSDA